MQRTDIKLWENDQPRKITEINCNGTPDGWTKYYSKYGILIRKEYYENGYLNGPYLNNHPDGKLRSSGIYKKNILINIDEL
jgi:antitoxin component YwqK of YwqJK toxin-antitoxin module